MNKVAERMAHEVIRVHEHGAWATDFKPLEFWSSLAPELLNAKVVVHNLKEGLAQDNLVVWNTELPVSWITRNEERLEAMCITIQRIAKQAEELHRFWEDQRDSSETWQCAKEDEPPFCLPPLLVPTRYEFVQNKVRVAITSALCNNPDEPLNQAFSICEGADLADEHESDIESVDEGSSIGDRSDSEDEDDEDDSLASLDEEEDDDDEEPVPPPKKQK